MMIVASHTVIVSPGSPQMDALLDADYSRGTEAPSDTWFDMRFQCPKCGRFVAESAVESRDVPDDSEYYGFRAESWTNCAKCGRVDDYSLVPVGEHPVEVGE